MTRILSSTSLSITFQIGKHLACCGRRERRFEGRNVCDMIRQDSDYRRIRRSVSDERPAFTEARQSAGLPRHVPLATAEIDRQTPPRPPTYIPLYAVWLWRKVHIGAANTINKLPHGHTAVLHVDTRRTPALAWKTTRASGEARPTTTNVYHIMYYGTFLESKFLYHGAPSAACRGTKGRFHTENKG